MKKEWGIRGKKPQHQIRTCERDGCNITVPDSRAYKLKRFCSKYCMQKQWMKHRYDVAKETSSP